MVHGRNDCPPCRLDLLGLRADVCARAGRTAGFAQRAKFRLQPQTLSESLGYSATPTAVGLIWDWASAAAATAWRRTRLSVFTAGSPPRPNKSCSRTYSPCLLYTSPS